MPIRISRRCSVSLATSCVCVLAVASCGTAHQAPTADPGRAESPVAGRALSAQYTLALVEIGRPRVRVTTAGPDLIRFEWVIPTDYPPTRWLVIYDGDRLFAHLNDFEDPYQPAECSTTTCARGCSCRAAPD